MHVLERKWATALSEYSIVRRMHGRRGKAEEVTVRAHLQDE